MRAVIKDNSTFSLEFLDCLYRKRILIPKEIGHIENICAIRAICVT
jgi:hypothetical protein